MIPLACKLLPVASEGEEEGAEEGAEEEVDILAAYARLVASPLFLSLFSSGLAGFSAVQLLLLLAAWMPSIPCMAMASLAYVWQFPGGMPYKFCEDYWTFLLNLGGLLVLCSYWLASCRMRTLDPSRTRRMAASEYMLVMRVQYWLIWAGVACWKSNTSFLDHRVSCASILAIELMDTWCPSALLGLLGGPERTAYLLVRAAPSLTVLVEGSIPVLLSWPGRPRSAGVVLGLLLGLCLALLPYDNNASEFSVWCAIRYVLFLPQASAVALGELWMLPGRLLARLAESTVAFPARALPDPSASALVAAALLLLGWPPVSAALFPSANSVTARTYLPLFACLCWVLLRAVVLEESRHYTKDARLREQRVHPVPLWLRWLLRWAMWSLTFAYAFLGPIFGVQDIGLPHMYSNLAVHGGSNHLLLPTGLLQAAAEDADPADGNPFAGGVLLVTRTNSTPISQTFPAETLIPQPHRGLLRSAGHVGRQWSPEVPEIFGPGSPLYGSGLPPTPYTLPALELRRALQKARAWREPFVLEYARLPSRARGPNSAVGASDVAAQVRYEEDGHGGRRCSTLPTGAPCGAGEPVMLPPPGGTLSERLALRLLLSSAYAASPAESPSRSVGCYNR